MSDQDIRLATGIGGIALSIVWLMYGMMTFGHVIGQVYILLFLISLLCGVYSMKRYTDGVIQ